MHNYTGITEIKIFFSPLPTPPHTKLTITDFIHTTPLFSEVRLITEKSASETSLRDEKIRRVEFATPAYNLLNVLEQMGYKVVTSSAFVTGPRKFDTKDFIWTLHKNGNDFELY